MLFTLTNSLPCFELCWLDDVFQSHNKTSEDGEENSLNLNPPRTKRGGRKDKATWTWTVYRTGTSFPNRSSKLFPAGRVYLREEPQG